jgi:hypothetical protein
MNPRAKERSVRGALGGQGPEPMEEFGFCTVSHLQSPWGDPPVIYEEGLFGNLGGRKKKDVAMGISRKTSASRFV